MNTKDLLECVGGLTRHELYRYVEKGYVQPERTTVGKVVRNEFSEDDVEFIKLINYYRLTGFSSGRSLEKAHEMALKDRGKSPSDILRTG